MLSFSELIAQYEAGPALLRSAIAGMTADQLKAKPIADRWSTLEVVVHIADFEPILVDRMKRVIAMDRPLLLVADENLFVERLYYDKRDVEEEMQLIEVTRKGMARILKQLPEAKKSLSGVHTVKGLLTLEAILTAAANHIPHHLPFIAEKRKALGIS